LGNIRLQSIGYAVTFVAHDNESVVSEFFGVYVVEITAAFIIYFRKRAR